MEKIKILYIEDDENQRQFMADKLPQRGYQISTSPCGTAGIQKVNSFKPDVILCDLNMPDLTGIQVLNHVKKTDANIPVIILTAHGTISSAVNAIRHGAYDFIIKPFQIDEIETTVQKAMETKLLQQELRQSEANLQMLMENVPDVIYSLNPKGEFISLSPVVKAILEYEPAELIGTSVFKIIHKDDRERIREGFIKAAQSRKEQVRTVEFRMTTKSGEVKYFEVKGRYLVKDGKVYKSDGIARDVTKRKRLEDKLKKYSSGLEQKTQELEKQTYLLANANVDLLAIQEQLEQKNEQMEALLKELQKSRDEMQIIMDSNPDVILMVNNEGTVVTINNRVGDFFGVQRDEIENKSFENFLEKIRDCFEDFDQFLKASDDLLITKDKIFRQEYDPVQVFEKGVKQIKPTQRIVLPVCIPIQDQNKREIGKIFVYNDITAIKRADEQLRTIVNASPIPLIVSRIADGKILFVNEHLANLLGYNPNDLMSQVTPNFYYNPDDRKIVLDKLEKDGFVRSHEVLIKKPDGSPIWTILSVELTKIGDDLVAISGLYDINERKQAEEALRRERNFVSAVLDTASALMLVLDPQGRFVRFNRACEEVTGYTFEEVEGKHFWEIFLIPDEMERIKGVFDDLCAGYFPNEAENYWKTKDGRLRLIAWSNTALVDDGGKVEFVISTGIDITEHREIEDALFKSEQNYRELVENSNSIMLRWDRNGEVTFFNEFAQRFFGFSEEEILGKNVVGTIVPEMDSEGIDLKTMMEDIERNPEKYISNENENMKRNGERVWITWANKPIFDEMGNVKEILSIGKDITDRKKTVEELKRAHRIYREAIENVEGVPYLKDYVENKYDFIGEGIKNLLGISATEFTPDRMKQLPVESYVTDPKAPADPVEYGKAFLRGKVNHYRVDLKIKMPEGEEKWISDCSVPIRDEKTGMVTGSLGILQDITDRKRAEDRLRLYRKLFINSNDGIAIYDPEGVLIEQNPAHQKFYEYSDAEIRGKTADLIMGDEATQKVVQQLQSTGNFRGEISSVKKSGDQIDIDLSIFPILNEASEITSFAGIGRDITERKQAEALMTTRLRYEEGLAACSQVLLSDSGTERALTEAMQFLLQASNTSRVYIFTNFDDPKDGLCMRQTHEVCAPGVAPQVDNPVLQHVPYKSGFERWRNTLKNGKLIAGVVESLPESEREILEAQDILSILVIPLWVEGKWYGFIGFDDVAEPRQWNEEDIRLLQTAAKVIGIYLERKKVMQDLERTNKHLIETQAQLVQSEKMASLGTLVAGIAHEINTPVGAVSSMHDTLIRAAGKLKSILETDFQEAYQQNHRLKNTLKVIEDANKVIDSGTDRVTNIVRRLRSFARLDEAELKTVDIHEGLEDTLTLIHHEIKHNIKVIRNYGKIPMVACYPGQLNQVFLNLLMNAKHAIKNTGKIEITTYLKDKKVHIAFRDNGVGIAREYLNKIFDPGFTTKGVGVGTGLGLSICYKIMQAHHGELQVESEIGKGSTFTVIVPINLEEVLEHA